MNTSNYGQNADMATDDNRYFVTELLGTDLHRLLTSRPLEKQFIQYFLYQILVGSYSKGLVITLRSGLADQTPFHLSAA
jgi:hypothetical protein